MGAKIVRIVGPTQCRETVMALEDLLRRARAGEVNGLAYVSIEQGFDFTASAVGTARTMPTYVRGVLRDLDDQLAKLIVPRAGGSR